MNLVDSDRAVRAHLIEVDYEIQSVESSRNQKLLTNEVGFSHQLTPQTQLDLTRDGVFVWAKSSRIVLFQGSEVFYRPVEPGYALLLDRR